MAVQYLAQPWFLHQRAVLGASLMDSYRDVLDDWCGNHGTGTPFCDVLECGPPPQTSTTIGITEGFRSFR